jgi:hypothetical protein
MGYAPAPTAVNDEELYPTISNDLRFSDLGSVSAAIRSSNVTSTPPRRMASPSNPVVAGEIKKKIKITIKKPVD